ncbi:MAG: methyltransferase [Vicingaceae bacterium]
MRKGYFFVAAQFLCLAYFFSQGGFWLTNNGALFFHFLGLLLGVYAVYSMSRAKLSILPELKEESKLITHGPYRKIRHPMYTALLLYFFPYLQVSTSLLLVYLLLLITLILKLNYEEKLLRKTFPIYLDYSKKTYRLIPWLY